MIYAVNRVSKPSYLTMAWWTYKALRPTEGFFNGNEPAENESNIRR